MSLSMLRHDDPSTQAAQAVAAAEATLLSALEQQWRLWQQYLYARSLELEGDEAAAPVFDLPLGVEALERNSPTLLAQQLLATLPSNARACFDRYLEQQRQEAQAKAEQAQRAQGGSLPDPDGVERTLLAKLRAQAEGDEGQVEVPYQDTTYLLAREALDAPLSDADFLSLARPQRWSRGRVMAGLGLVLGLLGALLVVAHDFGFGQPTRSATTAPAPLLVGDTPATPIAPRRLELRARDGKALGWPLTPVQRGAAEWPLPAAAPAAWMADYVAPLVVCLGSEAAQQLPALHAGDQLWLHDSDDARRQYRLLAEQPAAPLQSEARSDLKENTYVEHENNA